MQLFSLRVKKITSTSKNKIQNKMNYSINKKKNTQLYKYTTYLQRNTTNAILYILKEENERLKKNE